MIHNSLEAQYKLSDPVGGLHLDTTINYNNLSELGGGCLSTSDRNSTVNSAALFNGTSHYLDIANSSTLSLTGPMSISCWFKLNALNKFQTLVSKWNSQSLTQAGYALMVTNLNKLRFVLSPTGSGSFGTDLIGPTILTTGVWYHAIGVYTGSQIELYLNNTVEGTPIAFSGTIFNTPADFRIGGMSVSLLPISVSNLFDGIIDDIVVTNATLTPVQRAIIFGAGSDFNNTIFSNAVAQYKLNETDGDSVWSDLTINNNHLTQQGIKLPVLVNGHGNKANKAIELSSSLGHYLKAADKPSLSFTTALSISCWFKTKISGTTQGLISKWNAITNEQSFRLYIDSFNKVVFEISIANVIYSLPTTTSVSINTWYNVIAIYDNANLRLHLNNDSGVTLAATGSIDITTTPLRIGSYAGSNGIPSFFLDGSIDDIQLWSTFLTETQRAFVFGLHDDFITEYEFVANDISKTPTTLVEIIIDTVPDTVQIAGTYLFSSVGTSLHIENPTTARPYLMNAIQTGQELNESLTDIGKFTLTFRDDFDSNGASYWRKWRANNPFYRNRRVNIKKGFAGFTEANYITEFTGVMQNMKFNANNTVTVEVKSILIVIDKDYPDPSDGELGLDMTSSSTSVVLKTGTDMSQYPSAGYVKIINKKINPDESDQYELIKYTSITNTTLNVSARGQFSSDNLPDDGWSVAADHETDAAVKLVIVINDKNPIDIISDLLVIAGLDKGTPLGAGDLDNGSTGSFNEVKDTWFNGITFRAVLDEPTSIIMYLREIREQCFLSLFQNKNQQIEVSYLAPPLFGTEPKVINDANNIIFHTIDIDDRMDMQVTRVSISYGLRPGLSGSDPFDYKFKASFIDVTREVNYKESKSKNMFSRWIRSDTGGASFVKRIAKNYIRVFGDGRRTVSFDLETKDEQLNVGDVFLLSTNLIQDSSGITDIDTKYYVIKKQKINSNTFNYIAYNSRLTKRPIYIGPAEPPTFPDYTEATEQQREYFFISNSLGEVGNDNARVSARYKLSDTPGGLWSDDTVHNIHLTEVGGSPLSVADRDGNTGNAAQFDGIGKFLKATNPDMLRFIQFSSHFSLACWFKLDTIGGIQTLLSKDAKNSTALRGWNLHVTAAGNLRLQVSSDGVTDTFVDGVTVLSTATWYHVIALYDGSNIKVYLNGIQDGSQTYSGGVFDNGIDFRIAASGDSINTPANFFDGVIDDVIIWHKALNTTQIAAAFAQTSEFGIKGDDGYYIF